jgi:hypothetical protein
MKWHVILIVILQLLFLVPLAFNRIIAGDEGFYLIAAKEVSQGALPYIDFFYPQMPLLPFVYGSWMEVFGASWKSARLLSALLTSLLGGLLFLRLSDLYSKRWGYIGVGLFAGSQFVFPWYITAKTYALSTLLLFASYLLFVTRIHVAPAVKYSFVGFMFGLAVNTRLFFCSVLLVFIIACFRLPRTLRVTALFSFLVGGGLTVLPDLYFMAMAFDSFWFSNMGYHMLRSNYSWARNVKQKSTILKTIIGWRSTSKFTGLQYPLVLIVGLLAPVLMWKRGKQIDLAFYIVLVLILTSFLPSPSYVQYFCVTVPFLVLGVVWSLREIVRLRGSIRLVAGALCGCFLFHYFRVVPLDVHKYTVSGRGVLSVLGPKESKTLSAMKRVASAVDSVTEPGDRVLTMWPGVLVGSHARPYRRLENHFALKKGHKVPKAQREKLHVMSRDDVWHLLMNKEPETVVLERRALEKQYQAILKNYEVVKKTMYYAVLQRS